MQRAVSCLASALSGVIRREECCTGAVSILVQVVKQNRRLTRQAGGFRGIDCSRNRGAQEE